MPDPQFEVRDKKGNIVKMTFDEVDFIIETTRLSYPRLWPDEPHSEEQQESPQFRRLVAIEFTTKFIPELVTKFNAEFETAFSAGTIQALYQQLIKYKASLKKNTEDDTSQASSTDSIASESPTNITTS